MVCPKCGSENVSVQVLNDVVLKEKHHSIIWWICCSWWWWIWLIFKWLFLTVPAIFAALIGHKSYKTVNKKVTMCACQNCGYTWKK
jgi:uncharacterized Zn finger protein